ncbi:MAG: hypothetical protein AB8I08_23625 [Sandaracinaceae bacterium]
MLERLRARRPRWGCLGASLVLTPVLACCFGSAVSAVVPPNRVDQTMAEAAFERERAVADNLGLTVQQSETLETDREEHRFEVPLSEDECVAFVAAAWGYVGVDAVRLQDGEETLSLSTPSGLAGHTQYCATRDITVTADVSIEHQDSILGRAAYSQGTLRYAVLTGRLPAGIHSLNRGSLTSHAVERLAPSAATYEADQLAEDKSPWGPPLAVAPYRARLVPESTAAYEHLRGLAQNQNPDEMTPRIDLLPDTVPALWRPLVNDGAYPIPSGDEGPTSVPAMAFEESTPVRVLAVVDAEALGRCVDVQLVLNLWGRETSARRRSVSGDPPDSSTRAANVMSDRVCAGRATYVADGDDHSPYLLRIFGEAAPTTDAD